MACFHKVGMLREILILLYIFKRYFRDTVESFFLVVLLSCLALFYLLVDEVRCIISKW